MATFKVLVFIKFGYQGFSPSYSHPYFIKCFSFR